MKRILALVLCLVLALGLCACKSEPKESAESEIKPSSSTESAPSSSQGAVNSIVAPESLNAKKYACSVASPDGVILRTGPSSDYEALGVIDDGAKLTELANQNGWVYVDVEGQQGWIFGQYVAYFEN